MTRRFPVVTLLFTSLTVKRIVWNTAHHWLERAVGWCHRFSDRKIRRLAAVKLQADEIWNKEQPIWIFAVIEVWSRLWPSTVVGKRSYQNTLSLFRDRSSRMNLEQIPLAVTDGFGFYQKVIGQVFGPVCLYGQVIKTRRDDRIVKVERRAMIGAIERWEQALRDSEDSVKLNTSFVERLNLTIRHGRPFLVAERYVKLGGRNVLKITSSCSTAITTSSGLTGR